ncbi:NADH:ubiquinone oxidoreductase [Candidatus Woesearchaeota archaeon]|nr:NADH:ubiquinone oxidoreductase [Candidatus Woesearchaeota archaeon]
MTKPRVGFYDLTGCQGCLLSVIFNEDEILNIINAVDIKEFRFIMGEKYDGELDICFIEGGVVSNDDMDVVKKLRERSKIVIALGTCACEGNIQAMRKFHDKKDIEPLTYKKNHQNDDIDEARAIDEVIEVEYKIPGCPPDREEIKEFIKQVLIGKKWHDYKDPVCIECKLRENSCLLDKDVICLGPIIKGGCKAVCTTNGLKCYGCRGLTDDANFEEYFKMMKEKGFRMDEVKKIMDTFMARRVEKALKGK